MNNICSLTDLKIGECGKVEGLLSESGIRRRLQDLGLIEGTEVECVLKSPCGDPCAYLIRGAVVALRCEDSECIMISV